SPAAGRSASSIRPGRPASVGRPSRRGTSCTPTTPAVSVTPTDRPSSPPPWTDCRRLAARRGANDETLAGLAGRLALGGRPPSGRLLRRRLLRRRRRRRPFDEFVDAGPDAVGQYSDVRE